MYDGASGCCCLSIYIGWIYKMYDKQRDNELWGLSKLQKSSLRDGPLEKLWGWGGGGIFEPQEFFFVIKFPVWICFRPKHEIFFNWRAWSFFHLIFPCVNIFFCTSPAPPHTFSNGPSVIKPRFPETAPRTSLLLFLSFPDAVFMLVIFTCSW